MGENLSLIIAFGAGLFSFFSPCVLPLIPSWLCVIGGAPGTNENRPKPVAGTVSFIFGFSTVFIVLSIIFTVAFNMAGGIFRYINIVAGIIVIIFGLNIIFNFLSFLNFEKRLHLKNNSGGIAGAFLAGGAFGAGWTPCIGPILTSILILAAQSGGISRAVIYLFFYSIGLGLPFLVASFFYNAFLKFSFKLRSYLPLIQRISGVLLIVLGVLIATGLYQIFGVFASASAQKWQPFFKVTSGVESATAPAISLSQEGIDRKVSDEVMRAFMEAGISVTSEGIDLIDFTLPMLNKTDFTLSDQKGKVVFLNFWATWCGPCRAEMPSMEAVYQKLKDKGFEIVAVNLGESTTAVSAFVKEYNLNFPVVLDIRSETGSWYNVRAIPSTYIIDRRGLIVARLVGSINWNTQKIIAAFELLLAE